MKWIFFLISFFFIEESVVILTIIFILFELISRDNWIKSNYIQLNSIKFFLKNSEKFSKIMFNIPNIKTNV